jgi:Mor family transcriptional regulator
MTAAGWRSKEARDRRDARIRELWAMGWRAAELAERFDLTRQRIYQIVYRYEEGRGR